MQLESGRYRGRIKDYGILEAKEQDKYDQVFIEFEVIGRYDRATGELEACPPAVRTYYKSTHPNSVDWLLSDLKSLGYDKPSFRYLDPEVEGAVDWFGKEIDVACGPGTSQDGTPREQWSLARARSRKKVKAETLARLDARCAANLQKAFGGAQQPAAPLTVPTPSDDTF
jgi:hypothetical protein